MKFDEHLKRSLVKAITYRILIVVSTAIVVYFLTKDINATFQITLVANIANTGLYIFHERVWNRIHWGKDKLKS